MYYYPTKEEIENQKSLILSKEKLQEDSLIPSLDGKFTPFRYFKHGLDVSPSPSVGKKVVISGKDLDTILNQEKIALVPYTVPFERSYSIVELQDLTSEKRITNLLYDAVYEGIPISDLKIGLEIVGLRVLEVIKSGYYNILLSDFNISQYRIPLPITFLLMYLENFLKEKGIDVRNLKFIVQSSEIKNPFEVATLLSLGSSMVYPSSMDEEKVIDLLNQYVYDLISKKGYKSIEEFIGSKNVNVIGLKNEFLELINPSYKSSFEVEGLSEIESYLYT
ncbi:glutamate synthase central domain-containing protein [Sulfurihydrogenibium azorense]|uniref:glutamate synthase central domain-containing protein n=1 Tax=Sulfurihydrogenibium azorense TaxID=309806 RepID=UPI00240A7663|nr:glutamate synthase central domain-containing protein [Sulfurihydrogenibium azorense]MDM7273140.1 glutamate synthase central domain-containing protein [Sulfurihydrogenibium azorense]